jgi:hypothetical protein
VEITSAIVASAANWFTKIERGWHAPKTKLEGDANEHGLIFQDCPESAHCDKGRLLSRRLGKQVPSVHTRIGPPDISFTEFKREWRLEIGRKQPKILQLYDEMKDPVLGARMPPDVRSVVRIRREITVLNKNDEFRYSLEDIFPGSVTSSRSSG